MDTKIVSSNSCKTTTCNSDDACLVPNGVVSSVQPPAIPSRSAEATLGDYLARRLVQIGVSDVFSVPGDYNLTLLDHLVAEPELNLIGCCNELNAGYAADGYARARGVGACVVTFTVGGLSVLNAIAGAYGENIPVICVVGAPNLNDYGTNLILHHTIGLPDFGQELRCFQTVTRYQAVVNNLEDAPELELSNKICLEAAVEAAVGFLNKAVKAVMVGGPKMRAAKACEAFVELADASGYPVAVMASAKGQVPEQHPHFIGTYWGAVSTTFCAQIVESADAYIFAGPVFSDNSSVGKSLLLNKEKAIIVQPERVVIGDGPTFGCVQMKDFLTALAKRVRRNATAYENYRRMYVGDGAPLRSDERKEALRISVLYQHIQKMLSGETTVIVETGDSWFNCQKLKLPPGCGYEFQMQYGSIGWSVGATLGYAQALPEKRVIACIGDGSFQMTAQEVSTMLGCGQNSIIFLINNGGYTIEVAVHDGPYNEIKNWNYTALVDAICNGQGKCWTTKVRCEEELVEAIDSATGVKNECLCFIEVIVDKNDWSREVIEWGLRTLAATCRPPNPR